MRERWVTSVMPEALSAEGGWVKRSAQGKRSSFYKAWVTTGSGSQQRVQCSVHPHYPTPLRGPPPTGTNTSLSPSSLSLLLSSTPQLLSLRRRIKSSHTHACTHSSRKGSASSINKCFLIGSEHWQTATRRTRAFYKYSLTGWLCPDMKCTERNAHMHAKSSTHTCLHTSTHMHTHEARVRQTSK